MNMRRRARERGGSGRTRRLPPQAGRVAGQETTKNPSGRGEYAKEDQVADYRRHEEDAYRCSGSAHHLPEKLTPLSGEICACPIAALLRRVDFLERSPHEPIRPPDDYGQE